MLSFHAEPFYDTVIVKKHRKNKQGKCNPEKKIFWIGMDILPDFFDNLCDASKPFYFPNAAEVTRKSNTKRTLVDKGSL